MHMCAHMLMCVFMCMDIMHAYMYVCVLCVYVSGAMRVKAGDI